MDLPHGSGTDDRAVAKTELDELLDAAIEAGQENYRYAVASLIDNSDGDQYWIAFRNGLARTLLLSNLLGTASAAKAGIDAGADLTLNPDKVEREKTTYARVDDLGEAVEIAFLAEPYLEAVNEILDRTPVTRSVVDRLAEVAYEIASEIEEAERLGLTAYLDSTSVGINAALQKLFWVSDVDHEVVVDMQALVAEAIRGETDLYNQIIDRIDLPEFIDRAKLDAGANLTNARLETIYRTNINTAFNEATLDTLRSDEVKSLLPLVQITEILDDRTRPTHEAMSGYINTPDEINRLDLRPPNGYNCRGGLESMTWDDAEDLGLLDDNGELDHNAIRRINGPRQAMVDAGEYPDPGFRRGPRSR